MLDLVGNHKDIFFFMTLLNYSSVYEEETKSNAQYNLRIIPTPWEVTLSKFLSIVSDFEWEEHLKYKLA